MPATFFDTVQEIAGRYPHVSAVSEGGREISYAEIAAQADAWLSRLSRIAGRPAAFTVAPSSRWIAAAAACDKLGISLTLLDPIMDAASVRQTARRLGLAAVIGDSENAIDALGCGHAAAADGLNTVTVLTSGTSANAKRVVHTWESLSQPVRQHPRFGNSKWLLTYPLHLYSGVQVLFQCLWNAGTVSILQSRDPVTICEQIAREKIEYVSASPSFWRRLLVFGSTDALRSACVEAVTLSGEVADDDILQGLRDVFPSARISHIYATTELGRCFAVSDGRAGFPADYLNRCPESGVALRVSDGELQVRSENRMNGYVHSAAAGESWTGTGDMVQVVEDRVLFRGRKSDIINIGGNKVHPLEVEAVLRQVRGVADVRVHAVPSSLVGSLIGATIAPHSGMDVAALRGAIFEHCRRRLSRVQQPRLLKFVAQIELSAAQKIIRRNANA